MSIYTGPGQTPPLPHTTEPWRESLKSTAGRLTADIAHAERLCGLIRMSESKSTIRNYIIQLGAIGEKISHDIQDALRNPENS